MQALEVLYGTRASLRGDRFDFSDWRHCTCGHVYSAAGGRVSTGHRPLGNESERIASGEGADVAFNTALSYIVRAAPVEDLQGLYSRPNLLKGTSLTSLVSTLTAAAESADPARVEEARRQRALRLVNDAIVMLEAEQRESMLALTTIDREPVLA